MNKYLIKLKHILSFTLGTTLAVVANAQIEDHVSGIDGQIVYRTQTSNKVFGYYQNGNIASIEHYRKGLRHGVCRYYLDEARIVSQYRNGKKNGWTKRYFKEVGGVGDKILYLNDSVVGRHIFYHRIDKLKNPVPTGNFISSRIAEPLYSFVDETTGLIGFKRGNTVVFEPQFEAFYCPDSIEHIAAVIRKTDNGLESVYITSQGRIIDSGRPYFFDNGPDAEHNGFIRFRDKYSEHVGLLNRCGEVVIPAKYNYLSHVRNGFLTAVIGADTVRDGEYLIFVGGEEMLLDAKGIVHIENFTPENSLSVDFYSVEQITSPADLDTARMNFLATNGMYYSFENYETAFAKWLNQNLISDFTPERFKAVLYPEVGVSIDYSERQYFSSDTLASLYYDKFYQALIRIKEPDCQYFYSHDSFYPGYGSYRKPDNTDEHPIVDIVITSPNGVQESFSFYRTNNGYRLIEATFRSKSYGEMD